ncbi:hypothetical protein [Parasphingorhabdus sp.]|uniref:hypothetical protein n=1 Tax=Parasphingorhabdus sp. TaxID=2709688 RepID=UPI0030028D3D
MSGGNENLREWVDELEQILSQLDAINASIAAIHVDLAIEELCQLGEIDRASKAHKAA